MKGLGKLLLHAATELML